MRWLGLGAWIAGIAMPAVLLSIALPVGIAQADVLIAVDKAQQRMTVSIDGRPTYHWTVSTGRPGYGTPSGRFTAQRVARVYYSKKYDNAPMPNAVFFHGGYAIHGTYEQSKLGRAVSHGCVRLARANAATLFALVQANGLRNTHVVIGDGIPSYRPREIPMARRKRTEPHWPSYSSHRRPRIAEDGNRAPRVEWREERVRHGHRARHGRRVTQRRWHSAPVYRDEATFERVFRDRRRTRYSDADWR
jgi:hypothetical protein